MAIVNFFNIYYEKKNNFGIALALCYLFIGFAEDIKRNIIELIL